VSKPGRGIPGPPGIGAAGNSGRTLSARRCGGAIESMRGTTVESRTVPRPDPGAGMDDIEPAAGAGTSTVAPIDGSVIVVAPTVGGSAS